MSELTELVVSQKEVGSVVKVSAYVQYPVNTSPVSKNRKQDANLLA